MCACIYVIMGVHMYHGAYVKALGKLKYQPGVKNPSPFFFGEGGDGACFVVLLCHMPGLLACEFPRILLALPVIVPRSSGLQKHNTKPNLCVLPVYMNMCIIWTFC